LLNVSGVWKRTNWWLRGSTLPMREGRNTILRKKESASPRFFSI
jgi:hypothetical protein